MKLLYLTVPLHLSRPSSAQYLHVTKIVESWRKRHSVELWHPRGTMAKLFPLTAMLRVLKARAHGADLCYVRSTPRCFLAVAAAVAVGLPVVLEINSTIAVERMTWGGGRSIRNLVLSWLEGVVARWAWRVVTISGVMARHIAAMGVARSCITVEHNGADLCADQAKYKPPQDDERLRVGYLGASHPWHRVESLVDLVLVATKSGLDVEVHLAGEGHERFRDRLPAELQDRWQPQGVLGRDEVRGFLAGNHVNVMPHTNEYGSPIKLFEYLEVGVPVAMPDLPVIREVVDDSTALLFKNGDMAELSAKITSLFGTPGAPEEMGAKGRDLIVSRHSWSAAGSRVVTAIEKAWSSSRA
ncbi:MAG: glycosyltransferase [Candidatus Latescibacteria bacterium]|nr:glycosyltransferase [Candidatus Latescibacterota bacterium]